MSDISLTNLYTNYLKDGKIDESEFKQLVDNVLKDGIIENEEAQIIYQIGKSLGDTKEFDINKLRKSNGAPVDKDIKELFKLGMKAREEEKKLTQEASNTCENQFTCFLSSLAGAAESLGLEKVSEYLKKYNITDKEKQDIEKKTF
ncbi:MAG: hypothetical protein KatS3mg068_2051 [Candidatus Sericytochromatia bacterium]|nr:MAG: hypothetical protein KatS3mg068_2051 [Candidatus Sericytochromatia bacterium]